MKEKGLFPSRTWFFLKTQPIRESIALDIAVERNIFEVCSRTYSAECLSCEQDLAFQSFLSIDKSKEYKKRFDQKLSRELHQFEDATVLDIFQLRKRRVSVLTGLVADAGKLRRLSCSQDDFIYVLPVAAASLRAGFQVYLSKLEGNCLAGEELRKWLQSTGYDNNGIFSPQFTSMHPAGGQEKVDEHGNLIWIPDKTKWAAPEGTHPPPNVRNLISTDYKFRRELVLENLHIVTSYFDARTINYFSSVIKELMQYDDVWWRYEFAKSRGEIHSHAIVCSSVLVFISAMDTVFAMLRTLEKIKIL